MNWRKYGWTQNSINWILEVKIGFQVLERFWFLLLCSALNFSTWEGVIYCPQFQIILLHTSWIEYEWFSILMICQKVENLKGKKNCGNITGLNEWENFILWTFKYGLDEFYLCKKIKFETVNRSLSLASLVIDILVIKDSAISNYHHTLIPSCTL